MQLLTEEQHHQQLTLILHPMHQEIVARVKLQHLVELIPESIIQSPDVLLKFIETNKKNFMPI